MSFNQFCENIACRQPVATTLLSAHAGASSTADGRHGDPQCVLAPSASKVATYSVMSCQVAPCFVFGLGVSHHSAGNSGPDGSCRPKTSRGSLGADSPSAEGGDSQRALMSGPELLRLRA